MKMKNPQTYITKQYGSLKVIEYTKTIKFKCGRKTHVYIFECINCGYKKERELNGVRARPPKTCSKCTHHAKTHGMHDTAIYRSWQLMKDRCTNKKSVHYNRYGGRGITYQKSWEDFKNFYDDMSDTWFPFATIDRVDNNRGYYKENCKWSTKKEQVRNRHNTLYITHNNQIKTLGEWSEILKIKYSTLYARYSRTGHI